MSLMDLITQAGGSAAINQVAAKIGLTPEQTRSAMAALAPSVASGLGRKAREGGLSGALAGVTADVASEGAVSQGNAILGQIFGSKEVSRSVAAKASSQTGIGADRLKALLPLMATLAAGAMASKAGASATSGQAGGLDSLIGMLDRDGDGSPLNDILGLAGKLFSR